MATGFEEAPTPVKVLLVTISVVLVVLAAWGKCGTLGRVGHSI
jgi:hypothetical protein